MTTSPARRPGGTCAHARQIETIETAFITELVAALGHLKNAAQLAGTPAALLLPKGNTVTEQQMSIWVAMNASHLLVHLDEITAQYPSHPVRTTSEPRDSASHPSVLEELARPHPASTS